MVGRIVHDLASCSPVQDVSGAAHVSRQLIHFFDAFDSAPGCVPDHANHPE